MPIHVWLIVYFVEIQRSDKNPKQNNEKKKTY